MRCPMPMAGYHKPRGKYIATGDLNLLSVEDFVNDISLISDENRLFSNPYRIEVCKYNLLHYFQHLKNSKVDLMLIGEAPGYRGCALTGIPFTDEVQLKCPENNYALGDWMRLSKGGNTKERSASAVWPAIREHHIIPLMWNIFPFHPYEKGKYASNRTPTKSELNEGLKYIDALKNIFGIHDSQIFAVGKKAKLLLGLTDDNHCIRHPANDYKKEFRPQFDSKIGEFLNQQY